MKKTIAIPVHLQKSHLSEAEREEKKKYGDHPMTPEEIEAFELRRAKQQLEAEKAGVANSIESLQAELDKVDVLFARALRKADKKEQSRLKKEADKLESDLQALQDQLVLLT